MDHDRLFKELLTTFFLEFLELFLPELAAVLEPGRIEFLDKEIFTDISSSESHEVDLLVKARFTTFGEGYFLIHVENQATSRDGFSRRMFCYYSLLHVKFLLPIFPVAIFSFDQPLRAEPDRYRIDFPNRRVLDFSFHAIQLNRLNWRDYLRKPNPVASALMAKMQIAQEDRPRVKLECLRMLATLKLDKARARLISVFMDSYLRLTTEENVVYNRAIETLEPKEREVVMEWTNEWIEQGKTVGLAEGRREGHLEYLKSLLSRRFGNLASELIDRIDRLSDQLVIELGAALFDFKNVSELQNWVEQHG